MPDIKEANPWAYVGEAGPHPDEVLGGKLAKEIYDKGVNPYDLGDVEKYNPKTITDIVFADRDAGRIPDSFNTSQGLSIRIEKVI